MELTNLELKTLEMQLKEYRKFLRLSCERDLYTIPQAAFRLNISENTFKQEFIHSGLLEAVKIRGQFWIPRSEIIRLIDNSERFINTESLKR